jgi:hypothetical protein
MTSDIRWTVRYRGRSWDVCGFKTRKKAMEHVKKHFLDPAERWEDVRPGTLPRAYRDKLAGLTEEAAVAVFDEAAKDYVGAIRRHTRYPQDISAAQVTRHRDGGRRYAEFPALEVVSEVGIFSVFWLRDDALSDLVTSYRPLPRVVTGGPRPCHFRDAARRRMNRARP